ncbi:MAG TPA: endonuclease [Dehalococcoidia bacterium]|nr:endonuclease [SAR202 cluster bacterium]HAA95356.1 endonuclease [Dehalococcoidia bacterium]|tara:strand:+ start:5043 stop:5726 length:684 start_codon:yes stop_codon:yes gene_type:complete
MAKDPALAARLVDIYQRFYSAYGPQHWWPGDGPFEVIAGAILTQSAAWTNVEMALAKMRSAGCWTLDAVRRIPEPELAQLVRSSGYFNAKARKLKAFAAHVSENYSGDLDAFLAKPAAPLREELLSIHGIGEETADDIIVYAAGKPSFVIDSYTRRIVDRLGISPNGSRPKYGDYQAMFHDNLPHETALFNEFHALWDNHAKEACAKTPRCRGCCLLDICPIGQAAN